jgi:hypothetical protein
MNLPINPETKVGALLDAYPGIEDVLISWVPSFSKLKNPILRKTVAKVATLDQAAKVGGVNVRDLVRKLREATGQELSSTDSSGSATATGDTGELPSWLDERRVCYNLDADSLLEMGEHPIGKIRQWLSLVKEGQIIRLTSSFLPAPLIEAMRKSGLAVCTTETQPGCHTTYITRLPT